MDSVKMMRVFVRVAQRAGFAAAARDLHMSRASVTKHVAGIEARVGVRLFDRTTRSVRLTEAGQIYLERCIECLQAFDDADAALGGLTAEPRGLLRIAAPFDFRRQLAPLITSFMKAYPAVALDVQLSNRTLDMVKDGIDVYLRIADVLDAGSIARPLAVTHIALWGAPAYFREHGRPTTPEDLAGHRFAVFDEPPLMDRWDFERGGRKISVRLRPAIVSNGSDVLVSAVCEGLALGVIPSFLLPANHEELIEPVLLDWSLGRRRVAAVYPHRRFVPAKVRVFVDALRNALGGRGHDPWWPADIPLPGSPTEGSRY